MNHQEQFDQAVIAAGGDFRKAFLEALDSAIAEAAQLTDAGWASLLYELIKQRSAALRQFGESQRRISDRIARDLRAIKQSFFR